MTAYRRTADSGSTLPAVFPILWHNFGDDRSLAQWAALPSASDVGVTHFHMRTARSHSADKVLAAGWIAALLTVNAPQIRGRVWTNRRWIPRRLHGDQKERGSAAGMPMHSLIATKVRKSMPHARIDMHRALEPQMPKISEAIPRGMVTGFGMGADDLFQIFWLHEDGELIYSPTFPNQQRDDIIFIELSRKTRTTMSRSNEPWP